MLSALTKLLPSKDWCYCGIILVIAGCFVYYTHHERVIGAQRVVAADIRAAQKQAAAVAKVESSAKVEVQNATQAYAAAISAARVPAPHIVCYGPAPGSRSMPSHAGPASGGHGSASVPAESTVPFDPAPGILDNDKQADAQVTLLQSYIRECQAAGVCAK